MKLKITTQGEYPHLWIRGLIQKRIREKAQHRCEECGMQFQEGSNRALGVTQRNGNPFIGTVHHINGDKRDCRWVNLVYLCQRCHYRLHLWGWIPGKVLPLSWGNTPPKWVLIRNLPYQPHPQIKLF